MKTILMLSLVVGFSLNALAGKVNIAPADNKVSVPNVISVYAEWVKDKGKKYDIHLVIHNEHDKPVIVLLKEMQCYRGSVPGELKHTFFNTGERTIDFSRGQEKSFNLVCQLGEKASGGGEYRIVLGSVYENPSGDGKTIGRVLKRDVEWKVRIAN